MRGRQPQVAGQKVQAPVATRAKPGRPNSEEQRTLGEPGRQRACQAEPAPLAWADVSTVHQGREWRSRRGSPEHGAGPAVRARRPRASEPANQASTRPEQQWSPHGWINGCGCPPAGAKRRASGPEKGLVERFRRPPADQGKRVRNAASTPKLAARPGRPVRPGRGAASGQEAPAPLKAGKTPAAQDRNKARVVTCKPHNRAPGALRPAGARRRRRSASAGRWRCAGGRHGGGRTAEAGSGLGHPGRPPRAALPAGRAVSPARPGAGDESALLRMDGDPGGRRARPNLAVAQALGRRATPAPSWPMPRPERRRRARRCGTYAKPGGWTQTQPLNRWGGGTTGAPRRRRLSGRGPERRPVAGMLDPPGLADRQERWLPGGWGMPPQPSRVSPGGGRGKSECRAVRRPSTRGTQVGAGARAKARSHSAGCRAVATNGAWGVISVPTGSRMSGASRLTAANGARRGRPGAARQTAQNSSEQRLEQRLCRGGCRPPDLPNARWRTEPTRGSGAAPCKRSSDRCAWRLECSCGRCFGPRGEGWSLGGGWMTGASVTEPPPP